MLKDGSEILVDELDPNIRKAAQVEAITSQKALQDQLMADQLRVSFITSHCGRHMNEQTIIFGE
jgi:hypothetical protein